MVSESSSTLPLLQPRVLLVDDETLALADNDLAVECLSFDAAPDFHGMLQCLLFLSFISVVS